MIPFIMVPLMAFAVWRRVRGSALGGSRSADSA